MPVYLNVKGCGMGIIDHFYVKKFDIERVSVILLCIPFKKFKSSWVIHTCDNNPDHRLVFWSSIS